MIKPSALLPILALLAFSVFTSCKKDDEKFEPSCNDSYTFQGDVKAIFQANCVSCHASYGAYAGVSANKNNIREEVATGRMPKNGSLTDDQKNAILCWIDAGAQDN